MNEKTNPEVNTEETAAPALEEIAEEAVDTAAAEETKTAEAETFDESSAETETVEGNSAEVTEDTSDEAEDTADEEAENSLEASKEAETTEEDTIEGDIAEEEPAKKKCPLQIPVIISICIVAAALLAYFIFTAFFLREPEGVTWSTEMDGTPYYFEFKNDGTLHVYLGSVEMTSTYQKSKTDDGNTITTDVNIGYFYGGAPATYTISGSRILGNQTLDCTYSEEYQFTLNQSKREKVKLDVPEDFTADEELLGSWVFNYFGYELMKTTFNADGTMTLEQIQNGVTYNGVYTITDSMVNFTFFLSENTVVPIEYSVDGDELSFMGYNFVREGSELANATADQLLTIPQE